MIMATDKKGETPKYLKRRAQQISTEFEMLNSFRPAQAPVLATKREMIVQQVIQRDASEAQMPNTSAIQFRIEEQNRVINPFQKSRVVKTKVEERQIKRDR